MKNNKGFTLVEILSVIVLIALLLGVGIPGINRISKNMKEKSLNTKIDLIEQAGILWGQDNKTLLQSNKCYINDNNEIMNCKKISIEALIKEDYLDSENYNDITYKNPKNERDLANIVCDENKNDNIDNDEYSCCVHIYKKNNRVYAYFGTKSCEEGLKDN